MIMLPLPPPKISLASLPTPIRKLSRLSEREGGPNIWLKEDYLTGFTLSGNKVRKLEYLLADALSKGATHVITCGGIQSNHCRATAFACAQLGLKCALILRNDPGYGGDSSRGQANHFLDAIAGAIVDIHPVKEYQKGLQGLFDSAAEKIRLEGGTAYCIPTGGSNGLGVWGYVECVHEIQQQCRDLHVSPDLLVCASGSGGTQAGLCLGLLDSALDAEVHAYAVCDSAAYFDKKVRADISACCWGAGMSEEAVSSVLGALKIETNENYIGPGYAQASDDVYEFIQDMAVLEGLLLDPVYTGKAFFGMVSELRQGKFAHMKDILFVHTGGGFGLFSHAKHFVT